MQQAEDAEYHEILVRAHAGELREQDYLKLTKRIVERIDFGPSCPKIITQSNANKQQLNLMGVLGMVDKTKEPVYLFIVKHSDHAQEIRSEIISIGDKSSNIPGPGIFAYTKGMPVVINSNIYTSLGIVNGKEGRAVDVSFDPDADVTHIIDNIHIVSLPPRCIYVEIDEPKFKQLDGLD